MITLGSLLFPIHELTFPEYEWLLTEWKILHRRCIVAHRCFCGQESIISPEARDKGLWNILTG